MVKTLRMITHRAEWTTPKKGGILTLTDNLVFLSESSF